MLLGMKVEAMVGLSGGDWRGPLEGRGGVEAEGFVDRGVEVGEGSGVRGRREGCGFGAAWAGQRAR